MVSTDSAKVPATPERSLKCPLCPLLVNPKGLLGHLKYKHAKIFKSNKEALDLAVPETETPKAPETETPESPKVPESPLVGVGARAPARASEPVSQSPPAGTQVPESKSGASVTVDIPGQALPPQPPVDQLAQLAGAVQAMARRDQERWQVVQSLWEDVRLMRGGGMQPDPMMGGQMYQRFPYPGASPQPQPHQESPTDKMMVMLLQEMRAGFGELSAALRAPVAGNGAPDETQLRGQQGALGVNAGQVFENLEQYIGQIPNSQMIEVHYDPEVVFQMNRYLARWPSWAEKAMKRPFNLVYSEFVSEMAKAAARGDSVMEPHRLEMRRQL